MNASTLITLLTLHDIGNCSDCSDGSNSEVLEGMGLVACKDRAWRLTPRGEAHVTQLMNVLLPVQAWVSADGEVIV